MFFVPDRTRRACNIPLRRLLACIAVVALAAMGLTGYAAAEPITTNTNGWTPENFDSSCGQSGGPTIEIYGSNGGVESSSCNYDDGGYNECNWTAGTCSFGNGPLVAPTPSRFGDVANATNAGVLDPGDPPTPTTEATAPAEPTATGDVTATPDEATITPTVPADATAADTGAVASQPTPVSRTIRGQPTAVSTTGPASLTLVAATCAVGYDLFAAEADPARDCVDTADGTAFVLAGPDVQMARASGQDGPGTAAFMDLADGTYRLQALLPSGTGFAFVLGCESNTRAFDDEVFMPMAMVLPNGTVGLTLQAGEALTCSWYDVQAAPLVRG